MLKRTVSPRHFFSVPTTFMIVLVEKEQNLNKNTTDDDHPNFSYHTVVHWSKRSRDNKSLRAKGLRSQGSPCH